MPSEVDPLTQVSNFWVPVSQIIPVLALAFVIESRRIAAKWRRENKSRLGQAVGILCLAGAMFNAEMWALSSMATGTSAQYQVWIALLTVGSVVFVLAFQPISFLVSAGMPEVGVMLNRLEPGSEWRRIRKHLHELQRAQRKVRKSIVKDTKALNRDIQREEADRVGYENSVDAARELIARAAAERDVTPEVQGRRADELAKLLEWRKTALDQLDARIARARNIQSAREEYLAKLTNEIRELDQLAKDTRVHRMFDEDAERIERTLSRLRPGQPEHVATAPANPEDSH